MQRKADNVLLFFQKKGSPLDEIRWLFRNCSVIQKDQIRFLHLPFLFSFFALSPLRRRRIRHRRKDMVSSLSPLLTLALFLLLLQHSSSDPVVYPSKSKMLSWKPRSVFDPRFFTHFPVQSMRHFRVNPCLAELLSTKAS